MSIIILSKENYEKEVIKSKQPVLIDFYADWCGACKTMAPIIDEIAKEKSNIKVCKANIDNEQELAVQFGVMSIPTIVLIKNAQVYNTSIGVTSKEKVLEMLN